MIFRFLDFLKTNSIDYCFTNGYEELYKESLAQGDNDILLKRSDFLLVDHHIKKFSNQYNYLIVQCYHQGEWAKNYFIYDPFTKELLNLDIYGELSRLNVLFESEDVIFENRIRHESIYVLSVEMEFIYYLIKKLHKEQLSVQCFIYLSHLFSQSQDRCKAMLEKYLPKTANQIFKCFEDNEYSTLTTLRADILNDFIVSNNKKKEKIFSFISRSFKRIVKPTGLTIGFLGPDGSGKSTIISELKSRNIPYRRVDYFHLKPIKKSENQMDKVVSDPHEYEVYSKIKSFVKLCYFVVLYNVGYIKNIIPLKIRSSLVIFDRYYDDVLVDSKRYRYGGSIRLAQFMRLLLPKPDLYFILTAKSETIFMRKQEVPLDELKRQIEKYKSLEDRTKYFNLDVDRTPDEIVSDIIDIIMERMNERY